MNDNLTPATVNPPSRRPASQRYVSRPIAPRSAAPPRPLSRLNQSGSSAPSEAGPPERLKCFRTTRLGGCRNTRTATALLARLLIHTYLPTKTHSVGDTAIPAQMSMESMVMGGVGVGGVGSVGGGVGSMGGFQLVREPTSGALLLLPAPPELPHAVVWGGVPYPSAPLLLPPPPTHNRKPIIQPLLTPHALIKIEAEPPQEKPPTFAPEPPQPLMTHHLYYQPEFPEQACRSQATSPAAPPTPPPDSHETPAHRDASNQTDHIDDDDDSPNHADEDDRDVACVGVAHFPDEPPLHMPMLQTSRIDSAEESSSEALANSSVVGAVEKAIHAIERDEALVDSSSSASNDLVIDTASTSPVPSQQTRSMVDVSGLELLSNSIEQFERTTPSTMPTSAPTPLTVDTRSMTNIMIKSSPKSPPRTDAEPQRRFEFPPVEAGAGERAKPSLDGLGLLCALAEQRFMEEVSSPPTNLPMSSRPFIKSEPLMSPTEHLATETIKKDRSRRDSSGERRKRSRDHEERLRHKIEKMRRYKREKEKDERSSGGELEASLRRVTACACGAAGCAHEAAPVPCARALVSAMEKDLRDRLHDLQRQCHERQAQLDALPSTPPLPAISTPPTPSTPAPSPDSDRGSSKKRKVGRPRKVSSPDSTETIVAKKPKSKSRLVGYLLAKSKLKGGIVCSRGEPSREDPNRTSKVRPKLKAEPILKVYSEEEENEWGLNRSASSSMESLNEVRQKNRERVDKMARKHSRDDMPELEFAMRRASASSDSEKERRRAKKRRKSLKSKEREEVKESAPEPKPAPVSKCTLTEDKLDSSPRVLTAMGGLFYAGKLSAVTAPDVYAITLDGERGNKAHILSREETLRDAILEVSPSSVSELVSGTRVCAYWSQQYRCLYPGTVAVASPDPHTDKFVAVEFDDGDSGRIAIEDIRFLEPNYPVVVYENPLFTLGKRRRNTSANSTEDKKPVASTSADKSALSELASKEADDADRHRDRKKLKKHKKEKLKRLQSTEEDPNSADYVKKKKKKHKCCEEHCKHRRHHKKHRKHRKRHHSDKETSSSGDDHNKKSSSDYMDSNKSNEDSGDSNDRLSTLIAVEKSPDEKMKTVIKKAVLTKNPLVKTAVLDFSNLGKITVKKEEDPKDNLKDSGIGLEEEPTASTSEVAKKKSKKRTVSATSASSEAPGGVSKMAAFLPGAALWRWAGAPYRRTARPRHRKLFHRAIQRGQETLRARRDEVRRELFVWRRPRRLPAARGGRARMHTNFSEVGEAAVFLSTGRADRPYIGRVEALWEARGAMAVRVRWFYHPEETTPCTSPLKYPLNQKEIKKMHLFVTVTYGQLEKRGTDEENSVMPALVFRWDREVVFARCTYDSTTEPRCGWPAFARSLSRPAKRFHTTFPAAGRQCDRLLFKRELRHRRQHHRPCPPASSQRDTRTQQGDETSGGLFESPHTDENDVQTISHKCEVLPLAQYQERMGDDPARYSSVYDNNDVYYLAGHYDPTQQTLKMEPDIPFAS
ncbi:hypothetical protein MSG28_004364 [Choristoneura fumiferana]|uniref:Uncharacterized protein n=1 Tax=Choristoneura fumiferana TaxID=7141 RepID=A0ACC0KIK1_CHOFU|nr:hypothetical protein MSG28_004364 [Choristoneura fumiferana]